MVKRLSNKTSASEMLETLKAELNQYRARINEINFELQDKSEKIEGNERKLTEPIPPVDVVNRLEGKLIQLKAEVNNLENKIEAEKDPEKEDKLAIFRQQTAVVTSKREELEVMLKELQEERTTLELEIEDRKKEIEKVRGPNVFTNNDFEVFQENLNKKIANKKKKDEELKEFEEEYGILKRTEQILKTMYKESIKNVKSYEQKYGMVGLLNIENEIDDLTQKKGNADILKGKTLEELSAIVEQLKIKIDEKRDKLKPLVDEHKKLKQRIVVLEEDHRAKKHEFERVIRPLTKELEIIDSESKDKKNTAFEYEISISLYKEKKEVLGLIKGMLDKEKANIDKGSSESYTENIKKEIETVEKEIQALKVKRDEAKNTANNLVEQTRFLNDLKYMLEEKLKTRKKIKQNTTMSFKNSKEQFNRVVIE